MEISVIIPTKDRPKKIAACLDSLAMQRNVETICEVIVVACGEKLDDVINNTFPFRLSYIHTEKCGQIYQRNLGINSSLKKSKYICFLDDDVLLNQDAIAEIASFIEKRNKEGIFDLGVSFNVVNLPPFNLQNNNVIKKLLCQVGRKPGEITKTGINTPITSVNVNVKSQWLGGGYTVWSRTILEKYPHREIDTRYAAGEDLLYSYPVGKKYDLFVCASAKISVTVETEIRADHEYLTRKETIAHLYLCDQHEEFSGTLYTLAGLIINLGGVVCGHPNSAKKFLGFINGIIYFVRHRQTGWQVLNN